MNKSLFAAIALGALSTVATHDASAGREVLVIVHSSNPANSLEKSAVKQHFLKQNAQWADGNKVRPADQEGEVRAGFIAKVLGMTAKDYERYWLERKYAAAEPPPKKVDDDEAMLKYVGASKGAIGFIDASALEENKKVKVVLRLAY
jgi:ABC-type phosphate transport system substrate-binding protein